MPGNMRLHTRPSNEFHSDDTPPSTRPSSAASTSSTPNRSTSMDSLHTNSSSDKPSGEEFIPTRLIRAAPKVNSNAMQFVKSGPANLHKSAKEQMKKAEVVKSLRKTSLQEEEEWQSSSPSSHPTTLEDSTDWQTNLDKWKNSRRKRNEDVLERVIEVQKYEKEEEYSRGRRKSKTFSEMREDKDKRGRKYNLVVHDTDNNDLSELGLNTRKNDGSSSLSDAADDAEHKDLDNDNKDTKSDAGFCTGSDTGSDGVFAEDNISDTSSALGDKKDAHDSLLDSGLPIHSKESLLMNEHISITSSKSLSSSLHAIEYTYDKAIEEYKMFAENSVKKRTPSLTSLSSNASFSKEDEKSSFRSQDLSRKFDGKPSYFHRELDRDIKPVVHEPRFMRRDRNLKVDINKRRSMFELRDIDSESSEQKQINRRSIDVSDKLKTKVMSFESVSESDKKIRLVTPTRDTKFKEKLANFSHRNNVTSSSSSVALRKKTPERDQNFYKKLQSFTRLESEENSKTFNKSTPKSSPIKTASTRAVFEKKLPNWKSPERKVSLETREKSSSLRSGMPLKDRIASYENLSPAENGIREKSVSMECLTKSSYTEEFRPLNLSVSVSNLTRRTPSTPYMVVELDEPMEAEEICTKSKVSRDYLNSSTFERREQTIKSAFGCPENVEDFIAPAGPPPRVPVSNATSRIQSSLRRTSASPTRKSPSPSRTPSSPTSASTRSRSPSPSINKISISPSRVSLLPDLNVTSSRCPALSSRTLPPDATSVDTSTPSVKSVSSSPTRVSRPPPTDLVPKDSPPEIPKCPPPEIPMCPPPLYSNGYSEDQRLTFEIQSMEMIDDFSHTENAVDDSSLKEYGDDDIDEVIDNYEHLSESVTGTELPQEHYYESTLDNMGSLPKDHLTKDLYEENMYERIHDDEPMYENIYEKVNENANMEPSDYLLDHQYQTLEEVKTEVESFTSPPLPPKNTISTNTEVLDVTWTDESTSPVLPPSVPPPPPPPDEDDFEDGTDGEGTVPHLIPPSESFLQMEDWQPKPKTSAKQELRQKMSDFLGTKPQVQEEIFLKPPPDVNEILRQERVEERLIVQKQQNLSRDLSLLDYDPLTPQPYRPRYTWEDRMKADSAKPHDLDESCDHLDFQMKLEELEQEMVKHDREMLQRIKTNEPVEERTKESVGRSQTLPDSMMNFDPPNDVDLSQSDHFNQILEIERSFNSKSSKVSVEQKYSNSSSNIPPPSQYGEFPSIPTPQQVYSDRYYDDGSTSVVAPQPPPRQTNATSQNGSPANLPIQEFYTAPVFNDQHSRVSNNLDYQENSSFEEDSKSLQRSQYRSEVSPPKDSQPRKQSILALSAIPKPRLTDNDSWIMKKKADAGKKDYNKHWLFQEAEQRRLEQQDRISRVRPPLTESSSLNNLSNNIQTSPSYQNHFQNVKSNFNQCSYNYSSSMSNGSHSPSSAYSPSNVSNVSPSPYTSPNTPTPNLSKPPRSNLVNNSPSNCSANFNTTAGQPYNSNGNTNGSNNNWRKQTKTYQPEPPQLTSSSKPLPDSIINTLTQRVNNKNKNTLPSSKNPVYKSNYRDENYHDYMNTEFSSSSTNISPTIPQGGIIPQQQSSPAPDDHRLLSVSGKKKCSHCSEELGRGAAMIIESLRLFYHIPCFKCCVCGIQLGNGTSGADVRVRNHKLHCHNCYSNDEGMKFSKV